MNSDRLTPEIVVELADHLAEHFGSSIFTKADAPEMEFIGHMLAEFGVLDAEAFMRRYSTTIGTRVYLSFEPGAPTPSLLSQVCTLTHEHQHVVQFTRGGTSFIGDYLADPNRRAALEAEALRCNLEMWWWGTGQLRDVGQLAGGLVNYACGPEQIAFAARHLRLDAETVKRGGVAREASKAAISFLDRI